MYLHMPCNRWWKYRSYTCSCRFHNFSSTLVECRLSSTLMGRCRNKGLYSFRSMGLMPRMNAFGMTRNWRSCLWRWRWLLGLKVWGWKGRCCNWSRSWRRTDWRLPEDLRRWKIANLQRSVRYLWQWSVDSPRRFLVWLHPALHRRSECTKQTM